MAAYSFIQKHNWFDLTLPKSVVEICKNLKIGECGKFSFLEPTTSNDRPTHLVINQHMRVKTRLVVKKLSDGSWNLTNSVSETVLNNEDGTPAAKNVYIVNKIKENGCLHEQPKVSHPSFEQEIKTANIDESVEEQAAPDESQVCDVESAIRTKVDEEESGLLDHNYTGGEGNMELGEDDTKWSSFQAKENENKMITVKEEVGEVMNNDECSDLSAIISRTVINGKPIMSKRHRDKDSPACPICKALSKDSFNLMKHMKRNHAKHEQFDEEIDKLKPLMQVKCSECEHTFCNRKTLTEHLQNVHQNFMGIQCPHCIKKYRTKNHLRMHVKYAHMRKEKSFPCDQCSSRFDTKKILSTHVLYHHAKLERDKKCDLCEYKYAFQKQYYEHRSRVHGPKKEICPHCGYKCATRWYMTKHMIVCNKHRMKHTMPLQREALHRPVYVISEQAMTDRQSEIFTDEQMIKNGQIATDGQLVTDRQLMPVEQIASDMPLVTNKIQDEAEYVSADVSDALAEIEKNELTEADVSVPVVELPSMWSLQPAQQQVVIDSVVEGTEQTICEEEMVIVKQEEAMQQFAIREPDGTQHIIQLMYPNTSTS